MMQAAGTGNIVSSGKWEEQIQNPQIAERYLAL